jgi:hypothetical protein
MAQNTTENLKDLDTISPATSVASGGNLDQAKMAMTPAAKQGVAGIASPATNKGNVHNAPGVKPMEGETKVVTQEQKNLLKQKYAEVDTAVDINEQQRQNALAQVAGSKEISKLGEAGASIQAVLSANVNRIFNAKAGQLTGMGGGVDGLAALGKDDKMLAASTLTAPVKQNLSSIADLDYIADNIAEVNNWGAMESRAGKNLRQILRDAGFNPDGKSQEEIKAGVDIAMKDLSGKIAQEMGTRDASGLVALDWNKISAAFPNKDKFMATLLSTGLADDIKVDDPLLTDMGYDTPDERSQLKSLLGVGEDVSVREFQRATQNFIDTKFVDVRKAEETVKNPMASMADKQNALKSLRAMGYTGSLVSKEEAQAVNKELIDADTGPFTFGGKTYGGLKDALSDANITGLVNTYLTTGDDTNLPKELKDIVDGNKSFFESVLTELEDEVNQFNSIQKQDKEIKDAFGGDEDLMAAVIPGYVKGKPYATSNTNVSTLPPIAQQILDPTLPAETKELNKQVLGKIKTIPGMRPEEVTDMVKRLNPASLDFLRKSPANLTNYVNSMTTNAAAKRVKERIAKGEQLSSAQVLSTIFGGDAPQTLSSYSLLTKLANSGFAVPGNPLGSMTAFGMMSDPAALANTIDNMIHDDPSDTSVVANATEGINAIKAGVAASVKDNPDTKKWLDFASAGEGEDITNFANMYRALPGNENKSDVQNAADAAAAAERLGNGFLSSSLSNVVENHFMKQVLAIEDMPGGIAIGGAGGNVPQLGQAVTLEGDEGGRQALAMLTPEAENRLTSLLGEIAMITNNKPTGEISRKLGPIADRITGLLTSVKSPTFVANQEAAAREAEKAKAREDLIKLSAASEAARKRMEQNTGA